MAVAAMVSPSGPRSAGKYGIGMLSIATIMKTAYMSLPTAWGIVEEMAREHGQQVSRRNWRVVTPMHVAETREKAIEDIRFGLPDWIRYYTEVIALPFELTGTLEERCEQYIRSNHAIIGDPDEVISRINDIQQMSGGFGCLLQLAHNWADFPQTLKSYELMARFVMPHFQRTNVGRDESTAWAAARRDELMAAGRMAKELATKKHAEERRK
jgi:limonene 1,2-monooxygenase